MKYPRCEAENPAGQKFCGECGAHLAPACPACGAPSPPAHNVHGEPSTGSVSDGRRGGRLPAEGQSGGKVSRIGFLAGLSPGAGPATRDAFLQGRRERERLPDLAADLVGLKVDVIVAVGTPATLAATRTTRTIPIVHAG